MRDITRPDNRMTMLYPPFTERVAAKRVAERLGEAVEVRSVTGVVLWRAEPVKKAGGQ